MLAPACGCANAGKERANRSPPGRPPGLGPARALEHVPAVANDLAAGVIFIDENGNAGPGGRLALSHHHKARFEWSDD
jgi:hypothetical protein